MEMQPHEPERRKSPRTITPLSTPAALGGMGLLRFPYHQDELRNLVRSALDEDEAFNDLTTIATVVSDRHARGQLVARAEGVLCGVPLAVEAFRQLDPEGHDPCRSRGRRAAQARDSNILYLSGHARALLAAERVALNFMQRLSGIATLTARYVDAVKGTKAKILDTRKTTPGWRLLEKYAVRAGGGTNHRLNLSAAVLIKDNHLAAVDGDVALAVRRARDLAPPAPRSRSSATASSRSAPRSRRRPTSSCSTTWRPTRWRACVELVARPRDHRGVGRREPRDASAPSPRPASTGSPSARSPIRRPRSTSRWTSSSDTGRATA